MSEGTLSITTEPSPLALRVYDTKLNVVAEAVSPARDLKLTPGTYLVRASRPADEDLVVLTKVVAGTSRSVNLTASAPRIVDRIASTAAAGFDRYVRKIPTETLLAPQPSSVEPPKPQLDALWVRCVWLYDWETVQIIRMPSMTPRFEPDQVVLEIQNSRPQITFLQVNNGKGPPLNVALPPGGLVKPVRCELMVSQVRTGINARVQQVSNPWANTALQYMAQGYLDQAQLVIERASPGRRLRWMASWFDRFEDPAAALIARYLRLRAGKATIQNTFDDRILDRSAMALSDGLILSAEIFARQGDNASAYKQLSHIRLGSLPLYTEGFSLLSNRVRQLLEDNENDAPAERTLDGESLAKLRSLRKILAKWAPYIQMASPTLTFPGENLAAPRLATVASGPPAEAAGWTPLKQTTAIESIHRALPGFSLVKVPDPVSADLDSRSGSPELLRQIDRFSLACVARYHRQKRIQNIMDGLALLSSAGVTAAGVFNKPTEVALLGGVVTACMVLQRIFRFEARALFYRGLISEARILATDAKNLRLSGPDVVRRLNSLIRAEGIKSISS